MPARALLIEVHLLDGRYHGVGDWPPAPFRLYQALVAGAYGGRWRGEPAEAKDAAFRWLERLPAPHIAAPARTVGRTTTHFVPNNDLDTLGGDPRRVTEIRTAKPVRPVLFDGARPLLYAWPFDGEPPEAVLLCTLADRLHTLGRGIDAAFAQAETVDWATAEDRLAAHGGAVSRPAGHAGEGKSSAPCPTAGSLDSLHQRHREVTRRLRTARQGRSAVTEFRQPPTAQQRSVAYDRAPVRLLFELVPSGGRRAFRPVAQERVAAVAVAVRDMAAERLRQAYDADSAALVERFVVGRGAEAADIARRVRVIPLPTIGFIHADPAIRRVLVEIPPDCPISAADIEWALSGRALAGFERVDPETGEVADIILAPTAKRGMLEHYGVNTPGARRWQTVTPAALPEPQPRGRIGGTARTDAAVLTVGHVAQALRHAGVDPKGAEIRVQREPFHLKGARADAFAPNRFEPGRLMHVDVRLALPIAGPLVIGDGRWLGLGLMQPVLEATPDVHVFAIDPATAPSVSQAGTLTRALRRAVMARVADCLPRGEALPTFFTGHLPDGAPARSGRHEHLFFLADDADGDGRLDRLAIVAPHRLDRGVRPAKTELKRLNEAMDGLTELRAGPAGALVLSRADPHDPIFGFGRVWTSKSLYKPTRHPGRSDDPHAWLTNDLIEECRRRDLPRPTVAILQVCEGPRRGLACRAQLTFRTSFLGPLLLGQDCHLGSGLFVTSVSLAAGTGLTEPPQR